MSDIEWKPSYFVFTTVLIVIIVVIALFFSGQLQDLMDKSTDDFNLLSTDDTTEDIEFGGPLISSSDDFETTIYKFFYRFEEETYLKETISSYSIFNVFIFDTGGETVSYSEIADQIENGMNNWASISSLNIGSSGSDPSWIREVSLPEYSKNCWDNSFESYLDDAKNNNEIYIIYRDVDYNGKVKIRVAWNKNNDDIYPVISMCDDNW